MRTIKFETFGEPADVLTVVDVPDPEPRQGKGQVRVRMTHRPINPSDLLFIRGQYGIKPRLPAVPGFEGVGRIDLIGEDSTAIETGQRVVVMGVPGTWQEMVITRATQLIPVPDDVSDQAAAQLTVNPTTAWVMLTKELALNEGDWLLQTAAGSTLGRIILQIAKLRGIKTVNFVRRPEQVQELLDLGADAVICTEEPESHPVEDVMKLTRGQGVHAAIDAVGSLTGARAAKCLQPGGTLLVYGLLSGERMPLDPGDLIFKESTVRGFWLSRWFQRTPPEEARTTMEEVMAMMAAGQINPPVEAEYDLADVAAAVEHAERPGRAGKVLLTG
jgi:NADPH:quinone reductase-like Zn-dependent oxidoreductase